MGHKVINLFARLFLGGMFLFLGTDLVFNWSYTSDVVKKHFEFVQGHHTGFFESIYTIADSILPIWLVFFLVICLLFGILLILGIKQRLISGVLFILTLFFGFFYHPFWLLEDAERLEEMIDLWMYLGLLSALLYCFSATFEKKPRPDTENKS
ncbi:MAG: hypothetical protein K940chlam8_00367 [Chlamydiae bacterium]|nr:hypothetical protein [Chlamydiota bacterium]